MSPQHIDSHVVTLSQVVQKSSIFQQAAFVCQALHDAGFQAYFVGGCVRDFFLFPHFEPKDIDIATDADPQVVRKIFPNSFYLGKNFGVCAVPQGGFEFEVTTFRREGPYSDRRHPDFVVKGTWEDDALRRDFTINALYIEPKTSVLFDSFCGWQDLGAKRLVCIGDPEVRLAEDSLRILRLLRFAAGLNLTIEGRTGLAAQKLAPAVRDLSSERILQEMTKVKAGGFPQYLELWIDFFIMPELFPQSEFEVTESWWNLRDKIPADFHARFPLTALGFHLLHLNKHSDKTGLKNLESALLRWPVARSDKQLFEFLMQLHCLYKAVHETDMDVFQYSLYRHLKKVGSLPLGSVCEVSIAASHGFEPALGNEIRALCERLLQQGAAPTSNLEQALKASASQNSAKYGYDEISEILKQRALPQSHLGVWLDWQDSLQMLRLPQGRDLRALEKDEALIIVEKIVQSKKSRGKKS